MAFDYGENFRVLHIKADPNDQNELEEILSPTGYLDRSARKLLWLLNHLCETVVVEKDYVDFEYRSCFARFYYLRQHDTPRRCYRLHFFSSSPSRMRTATPASWGSVKSSTLARV